MSKTHWLGIDFGTTNSCMAAPDGNGNPQVIENRWGDPKTPSLVYFGSKSTRVGRDALELWERGQELHRLVTSPKLRLTQKGGPLVNGKHYSFLDAAVEVFRALKADAEKEYFHDSVTRAVVGHPVVFKKKELEALKTAAGQAGFQEVEVVEEPVAAAMAYAHAGVDPGEVVMVYDLGGGTFDLAVIHRRRESYQVALPPKGLPLGGDDFDQAIYDYCLKHWGLPKSKKRDPALLLRCRKAKESLSSSDSQQISFYHKGKQHTLELTQRKLKELLVPLVQRTLDLVREMLRKAESQKLKIDSLILIGGSTRLPFIEAAFKEELSGLRVLRWAKKDVAVALGAALAGERYWAPKPKSQPIPPEWFEEEFILQPSLHAVKGYLWAGDFMEGKAAFKEKNWNKARQCFSRTLKEKPNEPHALFARARCLFHQRKYKEALADLNALLEAADLGPGPYLWRAITSDEVPGKSTLVEDLYLALQRFQQVGKQATPPARTTAYLLYIYALSDGNESLYQAALPVLLDPKASVKDLLVPLCKLLEIDLSPQESLQTIPELLLFWLLWARNKGALSRKQAQELLGSICVYTGIIYNFPLKFCDPLRRLGRPAAETLADLAGLAAKHHRPFLAKNLLEHLCRLYQDADSVFDVILSVPDLVLSKHDEVRKFLEPVVKMEVKRHVTVDEPVLTNLGAFPLHDVVIQLPVPKTRGITINIRVNCLRPGGTRETRIYLEKELSERKSMRYESCEKRLLEQKRKEYEQQRRHTSQSENQRTNNQDQKQQGSFRNKNADSGKKETVKRGHEILVSPNRTVAVFSVAISPDGKYLLTGSNDTTAVLWNVQTGKPIRAFQGHTRGVRSVAFSPDGKYLLTGSIDTTAVLWNVQTGERIRTFQGHADWVRSVAFSPDGKCVLTGSNDKTAVLWNAQTGEKICTFPGHADSVCSVAFSPDWKYVLTGSHDKTAILWNAQTGEKICMFPGHADSVRSVAFSPDGKYVLTGSDDKTAVLWDVQTGEKIRTFQGHADWVRSVAFSPDGKYVLTGSGDKTAVLWDVRTGDKAATLQGLGGGINSVAFGPDGRLIATGLDNGRVQLWQLEG